MASKHDSYTIVIFRGHTATPWRLNISRRLVRATLAVVAALVIGELVLLSQYVVKSGEVWELRALREEVLSTREQTSAFSTAVEDLKRRLWAMKEVNQRLRVMLGIDEQKPEDVFNGQGGDETPLLGSDAGLDANFLKPDPDAMIRTSGDAQDNEQVLDKSETARLQQRLAQLQSEAVVQERILAELTKAAKDMVDRLATTPSVRPVPGWVTSGFGPRISPFTGQLAMHDGLDIGAPANTPIKAPAGGKIDSTGFDPKMGNMVSVSHGHGIETQYGHLSKILVKRGQTVKRGDVLGLVGNTGFSTGPHLHYMVKVNDRAVNPERYIFD
jgi:murein DD-endopeptidase MepM/ murein hydrolase activator NlpD